MAFDITTARPVSSGFDPSTARLVEAQPAQPAQPEVISATPPPRKQTLPEAVQAVVGPLPERGIGEKEWWTENLPASVARLPVTIPYGMGQLAYGAAKEFTDPVVNVLEGTATPWEGAKDLFNAPKDAGSFIINALAETTAAPLGLSQEVTAKQAWSDPAGAGLAIAPVVYPVARAGFRATTTPRAVLGGQIKAAIAPDKAKLEGQFRKAVNDGLNKSKTIQPDKKGSYGQVDAAYERASAAVQSILKNKEVLEYVDEFGPIGKGRAPQNLQEFSQAIHQLKTVIYDKYNSMTKKAEGQGVMVDVTSAIPELQAIIDDPVIAAKHKGMAKKAAQELEALQELGDLTPSQVQAEIQRLNKKLNAFDRNANATDVNAMAIDAMVRNHLRKSLDNTIASATGDMYQPLKNEYGALSSIEKAVNVRMLKDMQAQGMSTMNFYDVFGAHDLIKGALSGDVLTAGKGAGIGLVGRAVQKLKDPNRQVRKMFKQSEKLYERLQKLYPERELETVVGEIEAILPPELQALPPELQALPPGQGKNPLALPAPQKVIHLGDTPTSPIPMGSSGPGQVPELPPGRQGTMKALPPGERGFTMRNPEDVYSPYSPEFTNQLGRQKALPPGQGFILKDTPEQFRPTTSLDRMFQIAQSPEGKRLLVERLGREEKYATLVEEILKVPEQQALPPGTNYPNPNFTLPEGTGTPGVLRAQKMMARQNALSGIPNERMVARRERLNRLGQ